MTDDVRCARCGSGRFWHEIDGNIAAADHRFIEPEAEWDEDYGPGCDCTELCEMGPTCPGGMLAGLEGSGCWRTEPTPAPAVPDADLAVKVRELAELAQRAIDSVGAGGHSHWREGGIGGTCSACARAASKAANLRAELRALVGDQ